MLKLCVCTLPACFHGVFLLNEAGSWIGEQMPGCVKLLQGAMGDSHEGHEKQLSIVVWSFAISKSIHVIGVFSTSFAATRVCTDGKFRSMHVIFSTSGLNFLSEKINQLPSFCMQILSCLVEEWRRVFYRKYSLILQLCSSRCKIDVYFGLWFFFWFFFSVPWADRWLQVKPWMKQTACSGAISV